MSIQPRATWGEASFEKDRRWYARLSSEDYYGDNQRTAYQEGRSRALSEPEYDLFDDFMPTDRPKHDIGRYVMRHNVNVPLIQSMEEWQRSLMNGLGMIRSEHPQDYSGYSGLYASEVLSIEDLLPHGEASGLTHAGQLDTWANIQRTVEGPVHRVVAPRLLGNAGLMALEPVIGRALYDGTIDPSAYMRVAHWSDEYENDFRGLSSSGIRPSTMSSSRWQYIPGKSVRIMRDPVIDGKYFIGGERAHHHWQTTEGRESGLLQALSKGAYRGRSYAQDEPPEYELPSDQIIDLYEKIRTLPYFDQTQVPLLELQYGDDGKLYFLQYLKTGLRLNPVPEFQLPKGENIATIHDVKGATSSEGEKVRIYLDPRKITERMRDQAFWVDYDLANNFNTQAASIMGRVMVLDYFLSFKDNHFSSAPLTRAPVTLGLTDGVGEGIRAIRQATSQRPNRSWENWHSDQVEYIEATVTSNGRQATIESNWVMRTESV